ncbi:hypothetical protein [Mycolicibacterium peregrinum]|uniref:hypothetical protein n=1 Tax=Mycolicibacterium peregrinum TaxID=43304 RepID=UPI003AAB519D
MSSNKNSSGLGGLIVFVFVLIALVPKSVWIALGIAIAAGVACWLAYKGVVALEKYGYEKQQRDRAQQAATAANAKHQPEERIRKEKQRRIDTLGKQNAALVESALAR